MRILFEINHFKYIFRITFNKYTNMNADHRNRQRITLTWMTILIGNFLNETREMLMGFFDCWTDNMEEVCCDLQRRLNGVRTLFITIIT